MGVNEEECVSWSLVDRFFTDDGELDGIDAATAFAMGVEYALFRQEFLDTEGPFSAMVNPKNADRILKMC